MSLNFGYFTFYEDGKVSKKLHNMDFTYRVPGWCKAAEQQGFLIVSKTWKSGEKFNVNFPMEVEVVKNAVQGESVVMEQLVQIRSLNLSRSCAASG